jgi:HD superfamily phosphohydrolase
MITQLVKRDTTGRYALNGVKAFLCAALLHDLGHFPFAHSLKDLRLKDHEVLTAEQLLETPELTRIVERDLGVPSAWVAGIVDESRDLGNAVHLGVYRNLLSGVLDPDKLDYLNRDAYFCGVPYGVQDIDFIFNEIHPHPGAGVAISRKGLAAVEAVLFAKYLMFRNVYWHQTMRVITAMIKKAILMGLDSRIIAAERLYRIDDQEFAALLESIPYPPFQLARAALNRRLHRIVERVPFDEENPVHGRLVDPQERLPWEADVARLVGERLGRVVMPEDFIIDIPEPQSFEVDVPILEGSEWVPYGRSGSVFSSEVVKGFTRSLRMVSILCSDDDEIEAAIRSVDPLGTGVTT